MDNDFEDFSKRFWALQEEARGYDVESVVCLHQNDRLNKDTIDTTQFCGGKVVALGLVTQAQHNLMNRETEAIN